MLAIPRRVPASSSFSLPGYVPLALERERHNMLGVKVKIGEKSAYLAVDTGAPAACIEKSMAATLGVKQLGTRRVKVNGQDAYVTIVPSIDFGSFQIQNVPATIMDLRKVNLASWRGGGAKMDGLLGVHTLLANKAILSPGDARLLFRAAAGNSDTLGPQLLKAGWMEVPIKIQKAYACVVLNIDGIPARFVIDTGSGFLTLDRAFAEKNNVARGGSRYSSTMIGREQRRTMLSKARSLSIAGRALWPVVMPIFDLSGFDPAAGDALPFGGLLGSEVLVRNAAIIDFGALKLYLKPQ
ncbi:MAG: aspartyl protease family protein [Verrucomicrobiota bacterium]|nr:aspartyl protease family protein [Verrucomicrobiota bacterium]